MTGTWRCLPRHLKAHGRAVGAAALQHLRGLIPPLTLRVIFRALLGVLLFFCGIVFGAWLIFRYRRQIENGT
jgi:hypothetical protein